MRRPCFSLAVLFFCLSGLPALADEDAPYGLRWSETLSEAQVSGARGEISQEGGVTTLIAHSLPVMPEGTDVARLAIDDHYGLQRIIWVSKNFDNDATGEKGIAFYRHMKEELRTTYGETKSSDEEIGPDAHNGPKTFYGCLAQDGCAVFVSIWRTPDTDIRMRLVGTPNGEGWLEIIFFGPDWTDAVKERRQQKH